MNSSIGTQFVIVFYSCLIVIFILLSVVLLFLAEKSSQEELLNSSLETVEFANLLIEKEQRYLMGIAEYYSLAPSVQEFFRAEAAGLPYPESDALMDVIRVRMYCVSLAFYNLQGMPIGYMSIDNSQSPVSQTGMDRPLQRMISGDHTYEWEFIDQGDTRYMEVDNSPKIVLWYLIKDTHTFRPLGVVALSLDSRRIFSSNSIPDRPYNRFLVLDSSGQIVFSEHVPDLSEKACNTLLANTGTDGSVSGNFITNLDGQNYRIIYSRVEQSHFYTYLMIPYRLFTWNLSPFYGYVVTGLLLSFLVIFPILLYASNALVRPLRQLTASIQQFKVGDSSTKVNFHYNDEIGQLGQAFNAMALKNHELVEKTYLLKIDQQEAELCALQAQINPHFLYNLLNAIQWSALSKGETELAEIVYSMGQMFRLSLNQGNTFIFIRQERDLISYYLKLQEWQYRDRLVYTLDFSNDVLDLRMPKLIIQPLVENSVVHGMKHTSNTVHITVQVHRDQSSDRVLINVTDDGAGIPEETLHFLPDMLPSAQAPTNNNSRFAMKNIYDRLKLTYHDDFNFEIRSTLGSGTTIQISIPSSTAAATNRKEIYK